MATGQRKAQRKRILEAVNLLRSSEQKGFNIDADEFLKFGSGIRWKSSGRFELPANPLIDAELRKLNGNGSTRY